MPASTVGRQLNEPAMQEQLLVGLKHSASAHSYVKDLEDWRYLRRIGKIKHPARKLLSAASKADVKLDAAISPLSDLIVRQMIIRPGDDERDSAANISARRRLDDDCVASAKNCAARHKYVIPQR